MATNTEIKAMNKKEFKAMYAAARLIKNAAHANGVHNTPGEDIAWEIAYEAINGMPSAVSGAVWGWLSISTATIYPVGSGNKWAINHNSRAFGAVKCRSRHTL